MYKTIKQGVSAEITQKKSKFIANVYYVQDIEQAEEIIKSLKKKYYDARHNCYAYSITNQQEIIKRFSDDGEPSGTAGAPILNIIEKQQLSNILIVVTRYFGGILLGTGGLLRAYSEATLKALESAILVPEEPGMELMVEFDYSNLENFKYYCKKNEINITNIEYEDNAKCLIEVNEQEKDSILSNKELIIKNYKIIQKKNIRK